MRSIRMVLSASVMFAALAFTFSPATASAQAPAAVPPLCTGMMNIVRVSEIKPGMMAKFMQAVAAQQAWYTSKGTPDKIDVMRVMEQNPASKAYAFSETTALTSHIEPAVRPGGKGPEHDAGYAAFVALFRDSSTIKNEYVTCVVTK